MTLISEIFEYLWDTDLRYGSLHVNIFGIPRTPKYHKNSLRSSLSRLHKNNFVANKNGIWSLTDKGKKYFKNRNLFKNFESTFNKKDPKNLLVMFDINESRKSEREWFRRQLKEFKYIMIQKSVWVGPSPLPKEFREYIKRIKLQKSIKTFKLAKPYKHN